MSVPDEDMMISAKMTLYGRHITVHTKLIMRSEFEEWSRFASEIRDKAIAGEIPYDDYYTQIRK